jgi:hypothetical protein
LKILQQLGSYDRVFELLEHLEDTVELPDHLDGFDSDIDNKILSAINNQAIKQDRTYNIILHTVLDPDVKAQYPRLQFQYRFPTYVFCSLKEYNVHPTLDFNNFVCSFNGSFHVSRQLLVAILHKFKWFDFAYCSKNFSFTNDNLSGHIEKYTGSQQSFYDKFFLTDTTDQFNQTINSFGFVKTNPHHNQNIYNLESRLTESFIHIVSETLATSYVPFVTEKFLYSVVTRGLFLAYGQPGWHAHLEKYYGFKSYTKIFDYRFDGIQNPVERVVELMSMLSKFKELTKDDWRSLYLLETDTIEYNYNHYFSGNYLTHLQTQLQQEGWKWLN